MRLSIRMTSWPLLAFALFCGVLQAQALPNDRDQVVVKRGDAVITMADVDAMVGQLPADIQAGFMDRPEKIEQMLDGLLLARQIADQATAEGMDKGAVFEDRMRLSKDNVLMRMRMDQYLEDLQRPDFTILAKERYDADDGSKYGVPDNRDVSHILISTRSRTEEAAKKFAEELLGRLNAGEKFDDLARVYSDDRPGNVPEGDLTAGSFWQLKTVLPGKTVPDFEAAAWALEKPGDISGVVKTKFGYHIIRLDALNKASKKPFEDVLPKIAGGLNQKWVEDRRQQFLTSFKAQKMEANPEVVASLRTRYAKEHVSTTRIKASLSDKH